MVKVKGVYDGAKIVLLDPVSLPPNTAVEVLIPDPSTEPERAYWLRLTELGLIKEVRAVLSGERPPYTPVDAPGDPLSRTIIEDRR